jgi:hypothetical protein
VYPEIRSHTSFSSPIKEGIGFNIDLKAFPMDGRLVVLPPDGNDDPNG